ncbi:PcfJ domain-containing protein [Helicobacter typhlonius]|uniref:PcfJ domain-containing protein n=1 Tax=Helicobacter typhlonius TaxID=76936 RepID=UPI002FE2DF98
MQKIQNLIQSYKPLDFSSIDEKLLEEFPILKEWQKDELFMSFVESTKENYSIFRYSCTLNLELHLIPNSLFDYLEKILEANKNLRFSFGINEIQERKILFYSLRYDIQTKDILLSENQVFLRKEKSTFVASQTEERKFIILKENNECVFKIYKKWKRENGESIKQFNTKTFKTSQCDYLFDNEILRNCFLQRIHTPILKDLNLLPTFLLSYLKVDFNLLKQSHTIQDFVESALNLKIPFNLNKLDLFTALSFGIFLQFIEEKEQNKFYQFALSKNCPKIKSDEAFFERTCDIFYKRKKFKVLNLYYFYLQNNLRGKEYKYYNNEFILKDYTKLIYETKSKINLKIQSPQRISQEHDLLVRKLNESKIPKKKKLTIHQSFMDLKLPKNFKLLKTERELFLQGEKQNNCVYTRKDKVNRGTSAIYDLDYQGDYTLEITKRKEKFIIFELKGKHNAEPIEEIYSYVRKELEKVNSKNTKIMEGKCYCGMV